MLIVAVVPSCYVGTNCGGRTVGNISTTFSECCTRLSGVSFELERQCKMCPTSGMYILVLRKLKYICSCICSHFIIVLTDCPFKPRDVVLVLDNSFAVGSSGFQLVRQFAESVSITLKIGYPNSSVGVILFDEFANIAFNLEEHSTVETLITAINPGLPYSGRSFRPNTTDALSLLLSSSLDNVNESSEENNTIGLTANTTNIAIVFTASGSTNQFSTRNAAFQLHASNIYNVYAVGIDNYDRFELRTIASDPSLLFTGNRFSSSSGVQQLQRLVLDQLCNGKPSIASVS